MSKQLKCVNADGQPRLEQGAVYELAFDVKSAIDSRDGQSKSGYLVKELDQNVLIPYVYDRSRFVDPSIVFVVTNDVNTSVVTRNDGVYARVEFRGANCASEAADYAYLKNNA